MARLRRTVDEVVIAAAVGVLFIALACVEGLRVPNAELIPSVTALQVAPGEPIALVGPGTAAPVR